MNKCEKGREQYDALTLGVESQTFPWSILHTFENNEGGLLLPKLLVAQGFYGIQPRGTIQYAIYFDSELQKLDVGVKARD